MAFAFPERKEFYFSKEKRFDEFDDAGGDGGIDRAFCEVIYRVEIVVKVARLHFACRAIDAAVIS